MSRDPIGERGGLNLCGFVNNDPNCKIDISGLFTYVPGSGCRLSQKIKIVAADREAKRITAAWFSVLDTPPTHADIEAFLQREQEPKTIPFHRWAEVDNFISKFRLAVGVINARLISGDYKVDCCCYNFWAWARDYKAYTPYSGNTIHFCSSFFDDDETGPLLRAVILNHEISHMPTLRTRDNYGWESVQHPSPLPDLEVAQFYQDAFQVRGATAIKTQLINYVKRSFSEPYRPGELGSRL